PLRLCTRDSREVPVGLRLLSDRPPYFLRTPTGVVPHRGPRSRRADRTARAWRLPVAVTGCRTGHHLVAEAVRHHRRNRYGRGEQGHQTQGQTRGHRITPDLVAWTIQPVPDVDRHGTRQ